MPILHSILTPRISPVTASNFKLNIVYFKLTFEFLFTLNWSLVETEEAFVGVGDGDWPIDLLPGSFVHHAFWKRESVGNRRLLPQAKMLLALLKRSGPSVTKHYRKSSHSWTKENLWVKSFTFKQSKQYFGLRWKSCVAKRKSRGRRSIGRHLPAPKRLLLSRPMITEA